MPIYGILFGVGVGLIAVGSAGLVAIPVYLFRKESNSLAVVSILSVISAAVLALLGSFQVRVIPGFRVYTVLAAVSLVGTLCVHLYSRRIVSRCVFLMVAGTVFAALCLIGIIVVRGATAPLPPGG